MQLQGCTLRQLRRLAQGLPGQQVPGAAEQRAHGLPGQPAEGQQAQGLAGQTVQAQGQGQQVGQDRMQEQAGQQVQVGNPLHGHAAGAHMPSAADAAAAGSAAASSAVRHNDSQPETASRPSRDVAVAFLEYVEEQAAKFVSWKRALGHLEPGIYFNLTIRSLARE